MAARRGSGGERELTNRQAYLELSGIAKDLEIVEVALVGIYNSAYQSVHQIPKLMKPLPLPPKSAPPLQHPELPRCSEWSKHSDASCKQPALRSFGLCVGHFSGLFGHVYGGNYSFTNHYGQYVCKRCGRIWRYATVDVADDILRREIDREEREAVSEVCPARILSARALELKMRHAEKPKGRG